MQPTEMSTDTSRVPVVIANIHSRHRDGETDQEQPPEALHRLSRIQARDARNEPLRSRFGFWMLDLVVFDMVSRIDFEIDMVLMQGRGHLRRIRNR